MSYDWRKKLSLARALAREMAGSIGRLRRWGFEEEIFQRAPERKREGRKGGTSD